MLLRDYLPENTPEKWAQIALSPFYAEDRATALRVAAEVAHLPMPQLDYDKFRIFEQTGDRRIYESDYFERRRRLNALTLAARLEPAGSDEMLTALCNAVWQICGEDTWALPAHIKVPGSTAARRGWLDLFAAETGFALSELTLLLSDRLPEDIVERVRYEVRRRIILPYLSGERTYFWENAHNNWAAVCACGICISFLRFASDAELDAVLPRLLACCNCFLDGYGSDGCCREGYSYWKYGFGFFVMLAEALKTATGGKTDLLSDPRAKRAAYFGQHMRLAGNTGVSFADCTCGYDANPGISYRLHSLYPDVELPEKSEFCPLLYDCYRFGFFTRRFLWTEPDTASRLLPAADYYYPEAQWFITHRAHYALAAKGGHNNEPHNHNDIGSFIFVKDGITAFSDFGSSGYSRAYFEAKTRYTHLACRSSGHSVPIVCGLEQCAGEEYSAEVTEHGDGVFGIDITAAYPRNIGLVSALRRFSCGESSLVLEDSFSFSGDAENGEHSVTERFASKHKPELCDGFVRVAGAVLKYDCDALTATVTERAFNGHDSASGTGNTVYFIDLTPKTVSRYMSFRFVIE